VSSAGGDYAAGGGCAGGAFRPSRARTGTRHPSDIDSSCSIGISSSGWRTFSRRNAVAAAQAQAPFSRDRTWSC